MIDIKIFIAGSTHPTAVRAREKLRLRLSKIQNSLVGPDKAGVALFVYDCDDFMSQQEEYDKFIQNNADIFIAVVDAKNEAGEGTYGEYITACESYKKTGKPDIIVLYRTTKDRNIPPEKWTKPLNSIDNNRRYVIPGSTYPKLMEKLQVDLTNRIQKFFPGGIRKSAASKYRIGDLYDKDAVKGIIFEVASDGASGKIISLDESIKCTWQDILNKRKRLNPVWRVPSISELEQIVLNGDILKTINAAIIANQGCPLECDRWSNIFWSATKKNGFKQMGARWLNNQNRFSTDCFSNSLKGCIRLVKDVKF